MSTAFINKTRSIILKNIANDQFGVSELATELGLSRSQLLRKIKTQSGQSVNQFIRQVRLREAIKLMQNDDLNASEISYKVGFSSPSYFNKCFHDSYGFTPGEYKKRVENNGGDVVQLRVAKSDKSRVKRNIRVVLAVVLLLVLLLVFWKTDVFLWGQAGMKYNSILVLPIDDLSENKDKEYLAAGLTEAITLELSKIKGLRVPSRGLSKVFKDTVMLYSEIAKKADVDLLLEGSILYGKDSLRVTVQLISPFPKERHIWRNSYDQSTSDVLGLSREISQQIASGIHLAVSENGDNSNIIAISPQAQEAYLRGKQLWQKQNPRSVELSIRYLKEAIALEPDYAQAYCALAKAYMSKNKMFPGNNEEKLKNQMQSMSAIDYALGKAIELDACLAEAYITKGMIIRKVYWDWERMKDMAEKGLELNPNNKDGYMLLSDYYVINGNHKKAVQQALIAEKYAPINPQVGCLVADRYMYAGKYDEAIAQYKKVFELYPNYSFAWNGIGFVYFLIGDKEEARRSWMEFHKTMGNHELEKYFRYNNFHDSVNFFLKRYMAGDKLYCANPPIVAMAHLMAGKKEGALDYLDIAMEYRNEDLPVLIASPVFSPLHSNPHYLNLAHRLNVSVQP